VNHTIIRPTSRPTSASTGAAERPAEEVATTPRRTEILDYADPVADDPDPDVTMDLTVPSDARSARAVREFVRLRLTDLAADVDLVDDAVLSVSELLGNAVRHAPGAAEITVRCTHDPKRSLFTVAVHDRSHVLPRIADPESAESADSGRGLALVAALATAWGWHPLPDGKAVWFTFALPPSHPSQ